MGKDITNEQLFEFMTKMYGEMQEGFGQLNSRMDNMEGEIKKTNAKIDHEVIPKIDALFDGHKQNADKLDRIEEEVSKHEEIILKQVQGSNPPPRKGTGYRPTFVETCDNVKNEHLTGRNTCGVFFCLIPLSLKNFSKSH